MIKKLELKDFSLEFGKRLSNLLPKLKSNRELFGEVIEYGRGKSTLHIISLDLMITAKFIVLNKILLVLVEVFY